MTQGKTNETKDLEILRREYRNMEVNRRTFAEECNSILRKQQQTLDKQRTENDSLKTDVATLQARTTMKPLNSFEQGQHDKVAIEIERYKNSTENERNRINRMERHISSLREKIWHKRRLMGGANAAADNQRSIEKQVRILENRLDQALVKFNKSLAQNRKLREEIDSLRGERVTFDAVYKKLEKGLQDRKRQMAQVIEQSNLAYEQRDKSRLEITAIDQAQRKEQEQFDRQLEEMGRLLENEIEAAAERRKNLPSHVASIDEESKAAAEKVAKANALSKEKEACAHQRKEKIQNCEEAFRKIGSATGISDVDELVQVFISSDEQNFSLFTYANEQTNEVEKLEEQLKFLAEEKSMYVKENGIGASEHESALNAIKKRITSAVSQEEKYDQKSNEIQFQLDALKDGIKMLLTRLECHDDDHIGEISVNEANILHFLGVIEQRTNDILHDYNRRIASRNLITVRDDHVNTISSNTQCTDTLCNTEWANVLGAGPDPPMVGDPISVNPPRLIDYSSDEYSADDGDGVSRPLTRDELKLKTKARINQQPCRSKIGTKVFSDATRKGLSRQRTSIIGDVTNKILTSRRASLSVVPHGTDFS